MYAYWLYRDGKTCKLVTDIADARYAVELACDEIATGWFDSAEVLQLSPTRVILGTVNNKLEYVPCTMKPQ